MKAIPVRAIKNIKKYEAQQLLKVAQNPATLPDPAEFAVLLASRFSPAVLKMFQTPKTLKSESLIPPCFQGLFTPARYKIFYGGRGGAKSWSFSRALISLAAKKSLRILCTREFQSSIADSVHRLISDQIDALKLSNRFTIKKAEIASAAGSMFIFKGLKHSIQEIKSTEGIDIVWVEEAQAISETSWEILIPTIRKEKSEIWMSFNTGLEKDPTYQRFIVNTPPDSICRKVGWHDNPHFPAVLDAERRYMLEYDPEAYSNIWEGNPLKISDAVIFKGNFEVSTFEEPPENTRKFYGLDFGFSVSPTAFTRCWQKDNILYIDQEAWGVGVEIEDNSEFLDSILEDKRYPITADGARPETISYLVRQGYNVKAAKKYPGSVKDGIAEMKRFKKIVIHERCKHTIDDFTRYSYKVDPRTDEILPIIIKKHDDTIDAIRYSLNLSVTGLFQGSDLS